MKRNLVAHCQSGGSDKVYMVCVREELPDGTFGVIVKYGRRGKTLQQSFKVSGVTESQAHAEQRKVFNQKIRGGYVDVEDPSYSGPVELSDLSAYMESEPVSATPAKPPKPKPKPAPKPAPKEGVAVCVDNSGLEDKFDEGIEYVCEAHDDQELLWVYDKIGSKQECFIERFEVVNES